MNPENKDNKLKKMGLFIPNRHATAYVSGGMSLLVVVFFCGYFFGKKHMAEEVSVKIEQNSFADHVYSSFYALYEQNGELSGEEPIQAHNIQEEQKTDKAEQSILISTDNSKKDQQYMVEEIMPSEQYYAEIIGYGTQKAADQFAQKLQKQKLPVRVKTRQSSNEQGKNKKWYQVTTELFTDRKALEALTDRIARDEKIRGIQIVSC